VRSRAASQVRSCATAPDDAGTVTPPLGDFATWPRPPASTQVACTRTCFVTTMLDAGVDLRDVQIAARHADPRTTMRYDRARDNLDRHPNYILVAFLASAT